MSGSAQKVIDAGLQPQRSLEEWAAQDTGICDCLAVVSGESLNTLDGEHREADTRMAAHVAQCHNPDCGCAA